MRAPGVWAIPMDIPSFLRTRRVWTLAQSGFIPVEGVVGCGFMPDGFEIPARIIGYASGIRDNLVLIKETFGSKGQIDLRIFNSSAKLAMLSDQVRMTDAFRVGTVLLAGLAVSLRLVGVQKLVRKIKVDIASPVSEISETIESLTDLALRKHSKLLPIWDSLQKFREISKNGADPLRYAVEHAAPSMFGDLSSDSAMTVTIAGSSERIFWAVRRTVAAIAVRAEEKAASVARFMTGIKRAWYRPLPQEPSLRELAREPEQVARELLVLGRSDTCIQFEAIATRQVMRGIDRQELQNIEIILSNPRVAYEYLVNNGFEIGSNLRKYWEEHLK